MEASKSNDAHLALRLFEDMAARGAKSASFVCSTILSICARAAGTLEAGFVTKAKRVFDTLVAQSAPAPVPEAAFTSIIRLCSTTGDNGTAQSYLDAMIAAGVPPRLRTYTPMLASLSSSAEEVVRVEALFRDMQTRGIAPSTQSWASLLAAFARAGRHADVARVLDEMLELEYEADPVLQWFLWSYFGGVGAMPGAATASPPPPAESGSVSSTSSISGSVVAAGNGAAAAPPAGDGGDGGEAEESLLIHTGPPPPCGGWRVARVTIDPAVGICPLTGVRLRSLDCTPAELTQLAAQSEALSGPENLAFRDFKEWLARQQARFSAADAKRQQLQQLSPPTAAVSPVLSGFEVIIDAPNVGFFNQNFEGGALMYTQIDSVVRHFQRLGARVLLVIGSRWLDPTRIANASRRRVPGRRGGGGDGWGSGGGKKPYPSASSSSSTSFRAASSSTSASFAAPASIEKSSSSLSCASVSAPAAATALPLFDADAASAAALGAASLAVPSSADAAGAHAIPVPSLPLTSHDSSLTAAAAVSLPTSSSSISTSSSSQVAGEVVVAISPTVAAPVVPSSSSAASTAVANGAAAADVTAAAAAASRGSNPSLRPTHLHPPTAAAAAAAAVGHQQQGRDIIPEAMTIAPDATADSMVALEIVARWQREGLVYRVPMGNNDDWFWLYAAVTQPEPSRTILPPPRAAATTAATAAATAAASSSRGGGSDSPSAAASAITASAPVGYRGVLVVSNDYMRDHHFSMLHARSFLKWRERHQTTFHFAWDKAAGGFLPVFQFPRVYSHRMQGTGSSSSGGSDCSGDGATDAHLELSQRTWHFPIAGTTNEWIVAYRDGEEGAK